MGKTNNIVKEISSNIDKLIVNYLTNSISEKQKIELNSWIKENDENKKYFNEIRLVWNLWEDIKSVKNKDFSEDWNIINNRISKIDSKSKQNLFLLNLRKIAAIFIPVVIIVGLGLLYWNIPGFGRLVAFETQKNIKSITLPDNSVITLNKNSKIIYHRDIKTAESRELELSGEAFFNVTHNNTPFIVNAGKAIVKVVGTSFNINQKNNITSVVVVNGEVKVINKINTKLLVKGEKANVTENKINKIAVSDADLVWMYKKLVFKNANLKEVCEKIYKTYPEIKSYSFRGEMPDTKITTTFNKQSLKEVLEELKLHFNKNFFVKDEKLIISD